MIASLRAWLGHLFSVEQYDKLTDKDRARTIYSVGTLLLMSMAMVAPFTRDAAGQTTLERVAADPAALIGVVALPLFMLSAVVITRLGYVGIGALFLVLGWFFGVGISSAQVGLYNMPAGVVIVSMILVAGVMLRRPGILLGVAMAFVTLVMGMSAREFIPPPATRNNIAEFVTVLAFSLLIAGIVYLFLRFSRLSREEGLNEALSDRLRLSEITTQITRRISGQMRLGDLFDYIVNQIVDDYPDIYHAQIFLIDEYGVSARLVSSTGPVGQLLLGRNHSLDVGSKSVIGTVTLAGEPLVARARSLDTLHRANELLPATRVEAAFPLRVGDRIIGALDLQSKEPAAFADRDVPIFQTLADHIAIAIDNARLFEESERRIEENRRLAEQARAALRDVERLNLRLTGHAWSDYLQNSGRADLAGVMIDLDADAVQQDATWTPTLLDAVQRGEIVERLVGDQRVMSVPVQVRGHVVGAMEFELATGEALTSDDLALVRAVSERFGLAIENARLYDESQRAAQREALINEIGARLQASNNIETTLNEAAFSLRQTLKANRVAIRLGPPPSNGGTNGKHGGGS